MSALLEQIIIKNAGYDKTRQQNKIITTTQSSVIKDIKSYKFYQVVSKYRTALLKTSLVLPRYSRYTIYLYLLFIDDVK